MKAYLLVLLVAMTFFANGQESNGLKLKDAYFGPGILFQLPFFISSSEFASYSPESVLLKDDFTDFLEQQQATDMAKAYGRLGVSFGSSKRPNVSYQLGMSFWQMQVGNGLYQQGEAGRFDTLVSAETGQLIFIDSMRWDVYNTELEADFFNVNLGVSFSADPENRWVPYGGFNAGIGMGYNVEHHVGKYVDVSLEGNFPGYYYNFEPKDKTPNEIMNKSSFAHVSINVPVGIAFKLGKEDSALENLALNFEASPMMSFSFVKGLKTYARFMVTSTFGVKYFF